MSQQATPPGPGTAAPAGEGFGGPPATEGFGTAPTAPPSAPPAQRSKGAGIARRILLYVVGIAVAGGIGLAYKYFTGAPETAKVGSCMVGQSADDLKTIDCSDTTAEWKVVGKVNDKTEAQFQADAELTTCSAFPTTSTAYWEGRKNGNGYVLCLEPITR